MADSPTIPSEAEAILDKIMTCTTAIMDAVVNVDDPVAGLVACLKVARVISEHAPADAQDVIRKAWAAAASYMPQDPKTALADLLGQPLTPGTPTVH